ncbi:MAG: hypothetical protein HY537_15755 [Deltaproteobacteria bacterium]|nr:hypothetical protein [Deltaproteobacteria bacterium]
MRIHLTFIAIVLLLPISLTAEPVRKGKTTSAPLTPVVEPIAERAPVDQVRMAESTRLRSGSYDGNPTRNLASGDIEEDINHYHQLTRRLGVDIGMMLPFGDFSSDFTSCPMLGIHFTWEAIPPFGFTVGMTRASSPQKDNPSGKLSVTSINIGTQASFPSKRFVPFVKVEGAFYFNDVTFGQAAQRTVTGGNDSTLTTVGLNIGLGGDFIVGREVGLGLEANYHWAVSKQLTTSTGTSFNLGSSFATINMRVNF